MRNRRPLIAAGITTVALAGAAIVWHRPPPGDESGDAADRTEGRRDGEPVEARVPTLAGRKPAQLPRREAGGSQSGRAEVGASSGSSPSEPAVAQPTPGSRVRGHVHAGEPLPKDSFVYVTGRVTAGLDSWDAILARATPGPDGSFELDVPAPSGYRKWGFVIRLSRPGVSDDRGWQKDANSGGVVEVDFDAPSGRPAHGRVVDARRQPLAGLRIALMDRGLQEFGWTPLPDRSKDDRLLECDSWLRASATTDDDGRFEFRGSASGVIASCDERWFLKPEGRGELNPDGPELVVLAKPAFRLEVVLSGDELRGPMYPPSDVAARFGIVGLPSRYAHATQGTPLPIVARAAIPDECLGGFTAEICVDTPRHVPALVRVPLGPGDWSKRVEMRLEKRRTEDWGTLVVSSTLLGDDGRPARPSVAWRRDTTESFEITGASDVLPRGDGRWAARLPLGRQRVTVRAFIPFGDFLTWGGEVEISRDAEARMDFPAVPTGRVLLLFPPSQVGKRVYLDVRMAGGQQYSSMRGYQIRISAPEFAIPAVPAGPFHVTGVGLEGKGDVVAGAETTIELVPPR